MLLNRENWSSWPEQFNRIVGGDAGAGGDESGVRFRRVRSPPIFIVVFEFQKYNERVDEVIVTSFGECDHFVAQIVKPVRLRREQEIALSEPCRFGSKPFELTAPG